MTAWQRLCSISLILTLLLAGTSLTARADVNDPRIIDARVLTTANGPAADGPSAQSPYSLMVQATSWAGPAYRYVLTVGNFTPWPMPSLRILVRYFGTHSDQEESSQEWLPPSLEPGQAASFVITHPSGPLPDGCHQIEIHLADGLDSFLVDTSAPGATTVWDVPLTDEMASYLSQPVLTAPQPEGGSKLGIHVTANNSPQIMDFVRTARPAVVVAVGGMGWLADVKKASPETITVARFIEGDQSITGNPVAKAREFVEANASRYRANPGVDYWLGWNEPAIHNIAEMRWYAAFEAERIRAMDELGFKVAVGNFSAGTPEAFEFEAFLPALAVAKEYGAILALHEYSAPTLRDGVGADIPGLAGSNQGGALTLRYRFWYDHYLRAHNLVLPLVITEAGIDGGVLRAPNGSSETGLMGWRDFYKPAPDGPSGIAVDTVADTAASADEEYLQQLSWYDDELRRDSYVLGFAVFNVGGSSGQWASFDVTNILPQMADLISDKS